MLDAGFRLHCFIISTSSKAERSGDHVDSLGTVAPACILPSRLGMLLVTQS
jgi:hypothetical protein